MICIILIGNLGAGKSAVAKELGLQSVVIDNYRRVTENEYQARQLMVKDIHKLAMARQNFIYETTGANQVHYKAMRAIKAYDIRELRVLLYVSEAESYRRCVSRGRSAPFGKDHTDSYLYIAKRFKNEWGDLFFDTEKVTVDEIVKAINDKLDS